MGRSGPSSRRKYSKKRSLKVSSEGNRKKKSRRNKSRKLRHRDDSFSSCSDDESSSSLLYSSSGSDSDYERKRSSRSRARDEIKTSKKRTRRRSVSEDGKKRKKSKKSTKIKKKKKSKRNAHISSASSDSDSDSESCSTCKDEDSSSDEGGSHRRSRGGSRHKEKGHRGSSPKLSDSYDNISVEKVNPMRLKSVITVANMENKEQDNMKEAEEVKEETVYDYDDYPSCKSNDSYEFIDRSNLSPERKGIPSSVTKEVNSKEQESNTSDKVGSETDDLESILRQKALENLSRYQGRLKTKPVDSKRLSDDQSGVKQQPTSVSMTPVSQPVVHRNRFTWRRDVSVTTGKDEKAETHSADLPFASRVENEGVNETTKVMVNINNVDRNSTALVASSSSASSSKEQQTGGNDNSQFEKKTMSVMRGGEMVQVSYKVYIPSRAPALARRQLKR